MHVRDGVTRDVGKRVCTSSQEAERTSLDDANAGGLLDLTASFLSLREKWIGEVCGIDLLHVRHRTLNAQRREQRVPLLLRLRWSVARGVSLRSPRGGL